ncbi:MAG: hypothetical protein HUJ31_07620, partial [Pseudomonadales bacterium]|nr:hypothetical protein [Pseudomonadales bacterium]
MQTHKLVSVTSVLATSLLLGTGAAASEQSLQNQVDALTRQVQALSREATTPDRATSKWHLSGYMDAGLVITDSDTEEDHFASGHFNPAFHFQYSDRVFFESELEIETEDDGSTHMAIEYNAVNVILGDRATLVVGKWLSPVGQFQERLHPSWINKMASAPVGFGHGGIQPLSDIGVQVRGAVPMGGTYFTYAVAVGNGPQGGHHGLELEGFSEDNNSDKSFHGRLGFFPMNDLEIGVSYMQASAPGEEADTGPITDGDFDLFGADVAFTRGSWDIRAEYLDAELSSFYGREHHGDVTTSLIPSTDWTAWYAQLAYRIPEMNWEPAIRVGDLDIEGHFGGGEGVGSVDVGVNYWIAPSATFRVGVQRLSFDETGVDDETLVRLQFAYGFSRGGRFVMKT